MAYQQHRLVPNQKLDGLFPCTVCKENSGTCYDPAANPGSPLIKECGQCNALFCTPCLREDLRNCPGCRCDLAEIPAAEVKGALRGQLYGMLVFCGDSNRPADKQHQVTIADFLAHNHTCERRCPVCGQWFNPSVGHICPRENIACVHSAYGCSVWDQRVAIGAHEAVCPYGIIANFVATRPDLLVPSGTVHSYALSGDLPRGFVELRGQDINTLPQESGLVRLCRQQGIAHLPDARGRFLRAADDATTVGDVGGEASVTLGAGNIPELDVSYNAPNRWWRSFSGAHCNTEKNDYTAVYNEDSTGRTAHAKCGTKNPAPIDITPEFLAVRWMIKL